MPKTLEIVSWNVADQINDPQVRAEALHTEPDLVILPEAYSSAHDELTANTRRSVRNAGYQIFHTPYDDDDGRLDQHGLALLAKPGIIRDVLAVRLNGRNALQVSIADSDAEVLGVHFDDRTEVRRERMARLSLCALGETAVIAGDFNAMYSGAPHARLLRAAAPFTRLLPSQDPVPGQKTPKLKRLGSLSRRTAEMAAGNTMQVYLKAGFSDAAEAHEPTFVKGPLGIEIDHIIHRGMVHVVEPTQVTDGSGLSDHKKIAASLRVV